MTRNARHPLPVELPMNVDGFWLMVFAGAVVSVGGMMAAYRLYRRHGRSTRARVEKAEIKSWENEGGNLAPGPTATTPP